MYTPGIHGTSEGPATSYTSSAGEYALDNVLANRRHTFSYSLSGYRRITFLHSLPGWHHNC